VYVSYVLAYYLLTIHIVFCPVTIPCIVQVRAKLPAFFTRDVGAFIGGYVILQDPNNNHIQVAIEKKKTKYI
jgi:hypothetical protein